MLLLLLNHGWEQLADYMVSEEQLKEGMEGGGQGGQGGHGGRAGRHKGRAGRARREGMEGMEGMEGAAQGRTAWTEQLREGMEVVTLHQCGPGSSSSSMRWSSRFQNTGYTVAAKPILLQWYW
jgi:hypothetical protein